MERPHQRTRLCTVDVQKCRDIKRILIVDDEPDTRDLIAEYFEQRGYEILQAANGLEALLQVKRMRPHWVILDLQMPRLGGLEALKRIHAFDTAIVVIVVTGDTTQDLRQQARALGAVAVLDKPFSLPTLLATLQGPGVGPSTVAGAAAARVDPSASPLAPRGAEQNPAQGAAQSSAARVLIVDDDPEICAMLEEILGGKGYAVRTVSDATRAVRDIVHAPVDVILLDIDMPGLSGVDALPTLRALAPRAAVIMVSGSSDVELSKRALAHGAFDYVIKPIDFEYLIRSLETALAMQGV